MGFKSKTFEQHFWRNAILYARAYETKDEAMRRATKTVNNRTIAMRMFERIYNLPFDISFFVVHFISNLTLYVLLLFMLYEMGVLVIFLLNNSLTFNKIICMYSHIDEHLRVCLAPNTFSKKDHFLYRVIIAMYDTFIIFWKKGDGDTKEFCEIFLRGLDGFQK